MSCWPSIKHHIKWTTRRHSIIRFWPRLSHTGHMHSPIFVLLCFASPKRHIRISSGRKGVRGRMTVETWPVHRHSSCQRIPTKLYYKYIYIYRNVYLMETKFYDCVTMEIITITIVKIRLDRPSVPVRCSLIIILKPYRPYSLEPIPVAVSPAFGPWTENGHNNNNDNKGKSRRSAGHMFPIRKRIHTLFRCSLPWNWSARVCVGWLCTQQAGIVCCEP